MYVFCCIFNTFVYEDFFFIFGFNSYISSTIYKFIRNLGGVLILIEKERYKLTPPVSSAF
jgi:hypothetical protein